MGMKSKSAHFGSGSGGPSKRIGGLNINVNLQYFAKMPKQRAQVKHIMGNRKGHLPDSRKNRRILERISSDSSNYKYKDKNGNKIYAKIIGGKEYWVYSRGGIIQNGGVNVGEFRYHKKGDE